MRKFSIAVACLAFGTAFSQTPAVLIEACNSMADAGKRLECLKAAMGAGSQASKAPSIDAITRAFAGMYASLEVGISYNNYQLAILDLAKALAAYKQEAGESGRESARIFEVALEAYVDAGTFWERSISFYARRGNETSYSGGLPVSLNGLDWLVAKYGLPTGKSDFWGIERGLPIQPTRFQLWSFANQKAEEAARVARPEAPKIQTPVDPEMQAVLALVKAQQCREYPIAEKTRSDGEATQYSTTCTDGRKLAIACTAGSCRVAP